MSHVQHHKLYTHREYITWGMMKTERSIFLLFAVPTFFFLAQECFIHSKSRFKQSKVLHPNIGVHSAKKDNSVI